jgi:hypothetical protein
MIYTKELHSVGCFIGKEYMHLMNGNAQELDGVENKRKDSSVIS